ncbi:MAG: extracellular solute-binding protein [Deltaproteobacteria bacterium]|nr:extracellular solute-binding protein [Deltaproteobacteria bacterium]
MTQRKKRQRSVGKSAILSLAPRKADVVSTRRNMTSILGTTQNPRASAILRKSVFCCLLILPLFLGKDLAFDRSCLAAQVDPRILEEAKKEGELQWYGSMPIPQAQRLLKSFERKYPFIKTRDYRAGGDAVTQKAITEHKAGVHRFDIIQTGAFNMPGLKKAGAVGKYLSPPLANYPDNLKDAAGYWGPIRVQLYLPAYNPKQITPQRAPKGYEDLLDPQWKGQLGMDFHSVTWFASILEIMGKERGLQYARALARQQIQFRRGHPLLAQLVASGEYTAVVNLYWDDINALATKGAPITPVFMDRHIVAVSGLAMSSRPPHPNAAKLAMDYLFSDEGQNEVRESGSVPAMISLAQKELRTRNLFQANVTEIGNNYNEYLKLFNQTFGIHR